MLKTNAKEVKARIMAVIREDRDYIVTNYSGCELVKKYEPLNVTLEDDNALCSCIRDIFQAEKYYSNEYARKHFLGFFELFEEWASGLALGGLFDYYYNVSAVDLLGNILEQTATERAKYTEAEAEKLLTKLIYREVSDRSNRAL